MSIHKPIIQRVARGTLARASAARDMVPQCLCWLLAPLFWEGRAVLFVAEGSLKVKVVLGVGACWVLERGWRWLEYVVCSGTTVKLNSPARLGGKLFSS